MPFARLLSLFVHSRAPLRHEFDVPDDRVALLVGDGVPLGIRVPGRHLLPGGQVEVRLLLPGPAEGGSRSVAALRWPFDRSLLYVDGDLVAILRPSPRAASDLSAWEGPEAAPGHRGPSAPAKRPSCRLRRFLGQACHPFPAPHLAARVR